MQLEFFEVPSPCVGVCESNDKGFCLGCLRTREERKDWINLDNDHKQKVIKRCIQREKRKKLKALNTTNSAVIHKDNEPDVEQPSLLEPNKKPKLSNDSDLDFGDFEL
jgi:predicted Fe-S protein YdhL (DUF1289 family)